jgi:hypothetical protein
VYLTINYIVWIVEKISDTGGRVEEGNAVLYSIDS